MSSPLAAVAAACCCPRETVLTCEPDSTAVLVSIPRIEFDFGCLNYIFTCGSGDSPGCCCPTGTCFGNGSPCDSPAWDCRSLRCTGTVTPSFVVTAPYLGAQYRTRIDCPAGINEAYIGGTVLGERPQCDSLNWPGGGGLVVYRQAYVGARACVPNISYPVPGGTCNTGCSMDQTRSTFMVRAILQPNAGQVLIDGCTRVIRKVHVAIDVVSSMLASEWCRCNPGYVFTDILSAGYSMEYYSYCCPNDQPSGLRGTYVAPQYLIDAAAEPITVECYRTGQLTYIPVKWPSTLVVS